jgi:hypothetical protein
MFSLETWYLGHKGGHQIGTRLGVHRLGVQWREPEREKDLVWTPDRGQRQVLESLQSARMWA